MKIVSYYCDIEGNTFYSDHAKRLKCQCDKLDIEHLILERNYGSTWNENCRAKPAFLLEILNTLKEPFIWLDVDCEVVSIDFKIKGSWGIVGRCDGGVHNFVHYINYSEKNLLFLQEWIDSIGDESDHNTFIKLYKKLNYFFIPDGYFNLGLAEGQSRHEYLKEMERRANV
jgi:hypothetical protein